MMRTGSSHLCEVHCPRVGIPAGIRAFLPHHGVFLDLRSTSVQSTEEVPLNGVNMACSGHRRAPFKRL